MNDDYKSCDNCYYENFDEYTYPCAMCTHGYTRGDKWKAKTVEVSHGHWERTYTEDAPMFFKDRYFCSVCGEWQTYGKTDYCPWCGAKMDEVTE